MKTVLYKKYRSPDVLKLVEIERPTSKPNEVLIKVIATTITSGDVTLRESDFPISF